MRPKYLYRKCDGGRFTINQNGRYSMDDSIMNPPPQYTYTALIALGFVKSLKDCTIVQYNIISDGHGDYDDISC